MRAAVCREFGAPLTIEEVELDAPGPGEVRVRIKACAICHSDIIYMDGGWGGELPAVFGHEAAGIVEEVGAGIGNVEVGDHVLVTLIRSCGRCHHCSHGHLVQCETPLPLDHQSPIRTAGGLRLKQGLRTGAFAEAVVVDQSQLARIPRSVPLDSASLLSCGVITGLGAAVNTAGIRPGQSAVVIGTGGVGLNSVQGARLAGADPVIAIDLAPEKREAAIRFGASHALHPDDAIGEVKALTGGRGADHVLVTVGIASVMDEAPALLGRGGTLTIVGMPPDGHLSRYDPQELAGNQQRILGSKMGSTRLSVDVPWLISLYQQKRLLLDELITDRFPLDRINEAVASARESSVLRNVILF